MITKNKIQLRLSWLGLLLPLIGLSMFSCQDKSDKAENLKKKPKDQAMTIDEMAYQFESKADIDIANEIWRLSRTKPGEKSPKFPEGYQMVEFNKAVGARANARTSDALDWVERGPTNVGGRTRHILVDVSDETNSTWFVGAAGGGIWKTPDAGASWQNMTPDVPNLSVVTIGQSPADPSLMYAGTGEGALGGSNGNGSGILKSTDGGDTWEILESTLASVSDNFWNTNEIIVSPSNANVVFAATSNGRYGQNFQAAVMKSTDAGLTWEKIYSPPSRAQQILFDPEDENTIYASILLNGMAKTTDGGDTWSITPLVDVSAAYSPYRTELAIAPSNPNFIYASIAYINRSGSGLFMSSDKGETWLEVEDRVGGGSDDYLVQGEYDNCIVVDPENHLKVYWGGVTLWTADIKS